MALTLAEMEDLLARHEKAEFDMDLEATMATLVDDPVYELPTLNWRIEGQGAVLETYKRMLAGSEQVGTWADRRVHAISDSALCREAYVYFDTPDKGRVTGHYFVVIEFQGDKILGERMYMDAIYTESMARQLGDDFGDVPGVSPLSEVAPPPVPRFDRAAAHAANSSH